MIRHGNLETTIYFLIWSSGVAISLYTLSSVRVVFDHNGHDIYNYDDFKRGLWGLYYDISDYEWSCWTRLYLTLTPWLLFNLLGAEILRRTKFKNLLPLWYTCLTSTALICHLGFLSVIMFILIVLSFYVCIFLRFTVFTWVLAFFWRFYMPVEKLIEDEEHRYLIEVASSWLILRCIAYTWEALHGTKKSISYMFGFSFYLPTMLTGPFLNFLPFTKALKEPCIQWTFKRFFNAIFSFVRCVFWYYFTIAGLHFVYVNAILLRPYLVESLTVWELAGLGIGMGHFFHLKYIVFYGMACAWTAAENYETPGPPCCVSRVYFYSVMWRRFDTGLYSFLLRYIYIPIRNIFGGTGFFSKLMASIACFTFIFVWHGAEEYVFYWVILNYIAVTVEIIGKEFFKLAPVNRILISRISKENIRRCHCLLAAPLHYFSMISNYFFIGSLDVGKIYVKRALNESVINNLVIFFFLYGAAQSALSIEMWESRKLAKSKAC